MNKDSTIKSCSINHDITEDSGNHELTLNTKTDLIRKGQIIIRGQNDLPVNAELICRFRADFTCIFANRAFCDFFGVNRQELNGMKATSFVSEPLRGEWKKMLQTLSPVNAVLSYENHYKGPNGEQNILENTIWALFDEETKIVEYQFIGRDLIDVKKAERLLQHRTVIEGALVDASKFPRDSEWAYSEKVLEILGRATFSDHAYAIVSLDDGITVNYSLDWSNESLINTIDFSPEDNLGLYNLLKNKFADGEPIVISDVNLLSQADSSEGLFLSKNGIQTAIMVPYYDSTGRLGGLLGFEYIAQVGQITEADLRSLRLAAGMLGSYLDRLKAEKTLCESEANFRRLADLAPALIFVAQEDHAPLSYFNDAFEVLTGYTREECSTMTCWDFIAPPYVELHRKYALACLAGANMGSIRSHIKLVTKSGAERWADLSACTIQWNDKPAILGMVYDITERKQLEEELLRARDELELRVMERTEELRKANEALRREINERELVAKQLNINEQRYRAMVDDQKELVQRYRPDGTITYVNSAYCSFFNGNKEEFIGRNARWPIFEEDLAELQVYLRALIHQDHNNYYMVRVVDPDGELKWLECTMRPIYENGSLVEYHAVGRDVTERKRNEEALLHSEEKFRVLAETSTAAIYVYQNGKLRYFNRAVETMTGYSLDELVGSNPIELFIHPDDQETMRKNSTLRMQGENIGPYRIRVIGKTGNEICLYTTAGIINFEGTKAILGVLVDITELKQMEEELLKVSKLESLGILAGGIAHDFNNILTVISGNLALAKMMIENEDDLFETLTEIQEAAFQARDLTQQLLTFSKGGAPIKETASIGELIRDSASFVLRGSNVSCLISIPDDLPEVNIDKGQISQVISNLIINAHEAMPDGGAISIKAKDIVIANDNWFDIDPGCYIRITIKDTGVGIPSQELNQVFDPYFTTKQSGHGLGLSTCYSIIKKHDGHILVESEPGHGTTAYVYLPVAERAADRPNNEQAIETSKGRILVMDDEEAVRKTMGKILRHLKYQVEFACHGQEAIDYYVSNSQHGQPFDAVIVDLTIAGGMGGKEAAKKILEIDPQAKLIVSSGYSNDEVMANYQAYGFCRAIPKPSAMENIYQVLNEVV